VFRSQDEELEFWSKHSALEFIDEGEEVKIDASVARAERQTQQISLRISSRLLKDRVQLSGTPTPPALSAKRIEGRSCFDMAERARPTQHLRCLLARRTELTLLKGVRHRAEVLGVPYQTLMQIWLAERLEAEEARLARTR